MSEQPPSRAALVTAISEQVRSLGLASQHIGHSFAVGEGLHPTDFRALSLIYEHERAGTPLTARALAQALDLSPGAVTYAVDRLAASGHVWRDRDADDGRRVVLRFAPPGRDVAAGFFGPLGLAHSRALEGYSDAELETGLRVLRDVATALAGFGRSLDRETPSS